MNVSNRPVCSNACFVDNDYLPSKRANHKNIKTEVKKDVPDELPSVSIANVENTVNFINKQLSNNNIDKRMEYSIHKETNRLLVKIVDRVDNSLIREFPSEKLLDLLANLQDTLGIILDERM